MFSIEGMNAFITGGTAGIGLAIAKRFAAAGAKVVIIGRRDGDPIAAEFGGIFIRTDVADEAQLKSAFEQAEAKLGKLDIVVNNAGIDDAGPTIDEGDGDSLQRVLDVNLKPIYNGLRYGPRHMNDGGSIINTSSVGAV